MKLFGIPFSGGNAYSYQALKNQLSANIRFIGLELPGHGTRVAEPLLYTIEEMTDDLLQQIDLNQEDDYAFFGHSLGALLAFLMCRKISNAGKPLPSYALRVRTNCSFAYQNLMSAIFYRIINLLRYCGNWMVRPVNYFPKKGFSIFIFPS